MSLPIHRADWFNEDFDRQFRWYLKKAGEAVAEGYLAAVESTVEELARHPEMGRLRRFRHPELQGIRSFRVARPFHRHVLFYRCEEGMLSVERVMLGARNLARRLVQPPAVGEE